MKKEITVAIIIIAVLLTIMAFSGCGYKGYIIVRDNPTDIVSVKKQGFIKKKDITGKGVDFYANSEMDFEYSVDKDGKKTYKFSSKKDSIWTKIWGSWKMVKPNEVSVGK